MSRKYEQVVVFDSGLSDAELETELGKIAQVAIAHSGKIEKRDIWGRRQLAYPMRKKTHGIYVVLVLSGDASMVADLRRQLKINDKVLRSLVVDKDQYAPDFRDELREESAAAVRKSAQPSSSAGGDDSAKEKESNEKQDTDSAAAASEAASEDKAAVDAAAG